MNYLEQLVLLETREKSFCSELTDAHKTKIHNLVCTSRERNIYAKTTSQRIICMQYTIQKQNNSNAQLCVSCNHATQCTNKYYIKKLVEKKNPNFNFPFSIPRFSNTPIGRLKTCCFGRPLMKNIHIEMKQCLF